MVGRVSSWLNVLHGSGCQHSEDGYPSNDQPESAPVPRRLRVQPMTVHLLPVGDQGCNILDAFGSFHWQQDTSCSAPGKISYFDDRGQSDRVEIKLNVASVHSDHKSDCNRSGCPF